MSCAPTSQQEEEQKKKVRVPGLVPVVPCVAGQAGKITVSPMRKMARQQMQYALDKTGHLLLFDMLPASRIPRPLRLDARRLDSLWQMFFDTGYDVSSTWPAAAAAAAAAGAASVKLARRKLETDAVACSFGQAGRVSPLTAANPEDAPSR